MLKLNIHFTGTSTTRWPTQTDGKRHSGTDKGGIQFYTGTISRVSLIFYNDCSVEFKRFLFYRVKLECDKLASEKTEMQRHYVMVSELK